MTHWQQTPSNQQYDLYCMVISFGGDYYNVLYHSDIPLPESIQVGDYVIDFQRQ